MVVEPILTRGGVACDDGGVGGERVGVRVGVPVDAQYEIEAHGAIDWEDGVVACAFAVPQGTPEGVETSKHVKTTTGSHSSHWHLVMQETLDFLRLNKLWEPCVIPRDCDLLCARWSCKQLEGCVVPGSDAIVCELSCNAIKLLLRYENGAVKIGFVGDPVAKSLDLACVHEH